MILLLKNMEYNKNNSVKHVIKKSALASGFFLLGRKMRLELTTPGTTNRYSNQLSYFRHQLYAFLQNIIAPVKLKNIIYETIYQYLLI